MIDFKLFAKLLIIPKLAKPIFGIYRTHFLKKSHYLCANKLILNMKDWLFLIAAIVFETVGTMLLKFSEQFSRPLPTIAMLVCYIISLYLLSYALRTLPVGLAYAIWGALGIVFITLIGIFVFKQVPDLPAYIGLVLITAGVLVINLFSKMEAH